MASPRLPTSMENLPNDVLPNIFIRLRAKQLAQMRCVCKPWNGLLSASSFIKSHLHHSIQNNDEILLVFDRVISDSRKPFTTHPSQSPGLESTDDIRLPINPQVKYPKGIVVGSVNGLICFCNGSYHDDHVIYIWNPSLSAVLTLPPSPLSSHHSRVISSRFGYDPKTDDYKVVNLKSLSWHRIMPQGEVYSMRKGSWELTAQSFPSHITLIKGIDEVCVDGREGHLHWLGSPGLGYTTRTIVAFDLGAHTFSEIPLPETILHYHPYDCSNYLGVLGGKLCVMSCFKAGSCEVWVMNEYGVSESWVKHQVFPPFMRIILPYGFTSHNKFLFHQVDGRLYRYDPSAPHTKSFKITGRPGVFKIVEYVDSLVWVAPAEREPSKGNPSISISKRPRLLKGLQMAVRGIFRCYVS